MLKSSDFFFFHQAEENSRLFQTFCPNLYLFPGFSRPGILKIELQALADPGDTRTNEI